MLKIANKEFPVRGVYGIPGLVRFWILSITVLLPLLVAAEVDIGGPVRVSVARVAETVIADRRKTTGVVHAWRVVTIAAEMPGRVVNRAVEPGYLANAGELLVSTDPRSAHAALREARATVARCEVDVADAEQGLKRAQRLLESKAVSQDVVDDERFRLERAIAQLEIASAALQEAERIATDVDIRAPFAGKVEAVYVNVGDYVTQGVPVAVLSDFSRARIITGLGSADVSQVAIGHTADISIAELGGLHVVGTVTNVGHIKDRQAGTFPVELLIEGAGVERLRQGLVTTVAWGVGEEKTQTAIPISAVVRRHGQLLTYVVENGVATERLVVTGRSDGQNVVIHEGLVPGEHVVIDGHFALRDGASVEVSATSKRVDVR